MGRWGFRTPALRLGPEGRALPVAERLGGVGQERQTNSRANRAEGLQKTQSLTMNCDLGERHEDDEDTLAARRCRARVGIERLRGRGRHPTRHAGSFYYASGGHDGRDGRDARSDAGSLGSRDGDGRELPGRTNAAAASFTFMKGEDAWTEGAAATAVDLD